ncbi:MAG: hypothetical protein M3438_04730 [Pseudomonadota bacterium]|nr:hypothetical protein [Sphingomonas sp.]MDQ3478447.1 hypothetical protein [Pseudomonadota bacterium]
MLNNLSHPATESAPQPAPEPVLRLASLRNALRAVDEFGGGPASDFDVDDLCNGWASASEAERRCFDRRSAALLAVASAGLEVVASHREIGGDVSPAALKHLASEIRAGLEDIERLIGD